jgi:hypothetical protein
MTQHDPVKVALVIAVAAGLANAAVQIAIQRDVNAVLPKDKRFPYLRWGPAWGVQREIFRTHREFYPDSELRTLSRCLAGLQGLSFAFIFLQSVNASP